MRRGIWCGLVAMVMLGAGAVPLLRAQESNKTTAAPAPADYRVKFVLDELQGDRVVNSRSYEMLAQVGQLNKLRAGSRLPVMWPGPGGSSQFQYLDVGMSIDCRVQEQDGAVLLKITVDASNLSLPEAERASGVANGQPIIQHLRSEVETDISPGKPTIVSSMDDPSGKRRFQLEVTATKVK